MAIYYCQECEQYMNDDYDPCQEHPGDNCHLICPYCIDEFKCRYCGELTDDIGSMHKECIKELQAEKKHQQNKDEKAEANYGTARN
ncbi:hypothetical protein [uncultured Paraglaciecola sp.]|uniref:hypothetical protein n=1 Tax=uncultured Paraglaciecola sp. TaxID=1765024 RepID=UPI002606F214|nr:hypothetical protein [uncultured Paraglaciecola sp.]